MTGEAASPDTVEEKALNQMHVPDNFKLSIHKDFRLFFSVIPHKDIPVTFARKCVKVILEMPHQIKSTVMK